MGSERVNREIREFLEAERKQEQAIKDKLASEENLEHIKKELAINAGKAFKAHQKLLLGKREIPPVSETVMYLTFQNDQEKAQWQAQESQAFRLAHPEYEQYRSDETAEQIADVYRSHYRGEGTPIMCREMLAYAFARCLEDGTLTEKELTETHKIDIHEPEPEPDWDRVPRLGLNDIRPGLAHHVERAEGMDGIDQSNGEYRHFSEFEISKMGSTEFKRTFSNGRIL
jgi:hypothetical protein